MKKICYLMSLFLLFLWAVGIGNVSAQETYVKWKQINWLDVMPEDGDVVVIVDLTTGMALSNDKEGKDPDAVALELNYDKDRILGDVPEKVQWTFTGNPGSFQFSTGENNENKLYADKKGLKVGSNSNCDFQYGSVEDVSYLSITVEDKEYFAGVEKSMFSNSWKLKEVKDGKPDDVVKDTRFAIFLKVDDSQKVIKLSFPYENYEAFYSPDDQYYNPLYYFDSATAKPDGEYNVYYKSSNREVAIPVKSDNPDEHDYYGDRLHILKCGTTQFVATINETEEFDKAQAVCTIRIYNPDENKGTEDNPFTVEEAIKVAKGEAPFENVYEEGRCYFIKGIINKVNNGMLSMFGDMGLDEMLGDDMDMDERMGDMDDFDMSEMGDMMGGMDLASIIPGFGTSEGVDYYISDDGTKDNRIKVVKGRKALFGSSAVGENRPKLSRVILAKLDDLSPGDEVLIFGPLVVSEDENMFAGLMGNGGNGQNTQNNDEPEDKKTVKVGELNYLVNQKKMLLVKDQHLYASDNYTKHIPEDNDFFFTLNGTPNGEVQTPTVKSADEEIAKWVLNDEKTDSLFTPLNAGNTKVTVKVKVIVQPKDPNDENSKEKYYTMKRKFNLEVRPVDKDPEGRNVGEYVLVKDVSELNDEEATRRLLIVGTRVKEKEGETANEETTDDDITNYILGTDNAMMGGGKGAKKIDNDKITTNAKGRDCIKYEDVPEKSQEIILEQKDNYWYLKVGEDENEDALYLYASDYKEENSESSGDPEGTGTGGPNMDEMMEMFMPSSGLKVGTLEGTRDKVTEGQTTEETVDSCMATITFSSDDIAIVSYPKTKDKKNTIMLTSSFDLDGIMNMFGGKEEEGGDEQSTGGESSGGNEQSTGGMNFDFFMGAFNSVKADDEKGMKPRIFMFKQYDQYDITIGDTEWMTFVSDYDVKAPSDVEAYVVTKVMPGTATTKCKAILRLEGSILKGGEPYLLHAPKGTYTMKRYQSEQPLQAPEGNLLLISDGDTYGNKTNSNVYVLGSKSDGVGFYRWTGRKLGAGRVYLEHDANPAMPAALREFISFEEDNPTEISSTTVDEQEKPVSYYNLSGQRVDKPLMKGIYITNGNKILIK